MRKKKKYENLYNSPYFSVDYNMYFIFESLEKKIKFDENRHKYIHKEIFKLAKKYKFIGNFGKYFTIVYYKKIQNEKFLIIDCETEKEIQEDIIIK